VAKPKLHLVDSGLADRLLRLSPGKLARREPTSLQELGDAFVAGVVLHTGPRAYTVEGPIHVVLADRSWTPVE